MFRFRPDISTFDNFYDKARFLLAWRISVAFSIVFFILAIIYGSINAVALLPVSITFAITASSVIYLKITKNFKPLFWVYAISGTLLANFAMNYVLDFTHYVDFVWIIACVLTVFIGLGKFYGIIFILLNCAGIAYFFWFTLNRHIEMLQPKTNGELIGEYIEVLFAFFVIAYLLQQYVVFQAYSETELKTANANLEEQNKLILSKSNENETLLKEIHHRVKNNLQIIISLLRMQSMEMKTDESKNHFTEAINRIMAMSLIHQKLYSEKELSKIDLRSYIEELVHDIIAVSVGKENVDLDINTNVENITLDTIVPLGLLINELVSNSLKHAFKEKDNGKIMVDIEQHGSEYLLGYSDNGTWIEPNSNELSFGLELINILTEQMNGEHTRVTEDGTHYSFKLKEITSV